MAPEVKRLDRVMGLANKIIDHEDMLPSHPLDEVVGTDLRDQRKMDLAVNLVDRYLGLLQHWQWGDSVLEWIRQCEITFEQRMELRNLLKADLWPHAGRSSFVRLLHDKAVGASDVELEKAVGLRLTFRHVPPISSFSDQFLFYLNNSVAHSAYETWAKMSPDPVSSLPPERFSFEIVNMSVQ
jgi:hypothetical protein